MKKKGLVIGGELDGTVLEAEAGFSHQHENDIYRFVEAFEDGNGWRRDLWLLKGLTVIDAVEKLCQNYELRSASAQVRKN